MPKINPSKLGFIPFMTGLLFLVYPAFAENWVEVTAVGRDKAFYDTHSAYVDTRTGLVVVKIATWEVLIDDFTYLLNGYDCSRWEEYFIGSKTPDGWVYDVNRVYDVIRISSPTSPSAKTARWGCDNYNSLPRGDIGFDFRLSR